MRERELKPGEIKTIAGTHASLPMRERELKQTGEKLSLWGNHVAPHAGARIETPAVS